MKAKGNWLSGLQMGISRHNRFRMGICLVQKRFLQAGQQLVSLGKRFAQPQPDICRHLIIARPGGVQTPCRITDQFSQPGFNIHMNIFQLF